MISFFMISGSPGRALSPELSRRCRFCRARTWRRSRRVFQSMTSAAANDGIARTLLGLGGSGTVDAGVVVLMVIPVEVFREASGGLAIVTKAVRISCAGIRRERAAPFPAMRERFPVSYTHLTLPT